MLVRHELEVWLFNHCVGTLRFEAGRLSFCYGLDWIGRPEAVVLSASLPLQTEPFDDRTARPFFAGLLPEGRMRHLIAQQFHVSSQNDFALLDHIGGECAGAVTFLEPGQSLQPISHTEDIVWLNDQEVIDILDELPHRPMLAGKDGLRLSLAGAQDKLPVVFDGSRIGLPRNGAPSSHILKPAIRTVEHSVINEGFCLALAESMGLSPVKSKVHVLMDRSFLLVERYDRVLDLLGNRQRIHQEDFCQALGVVPEMKYQNEGGPDLRQCFDLVRRVTRPSAPQILQLFDYVIFNALIGNHDAHAKNFSLIYSSPTPVLAPLYDALCTAVYPNLTIKMAMKIGSKYTFRDVHARHWEQLADGVGLAKAQAKKRVLELANLLPKHARTVQSMKDRHFSGNELIESIITLIEQRCSLTIQRLTSIP